MPLFLLPLTYAAILYRADPIIGQHSRHFLAALALLVVASSTGLANVAALAILPFRVVYRLVGRAKIAPSAEGATPARSPWWLLVDAAIVLACVTLHDRGQAWLKNETPRGCAHDFADHEDPWRLAPSLDLAYHASCYSSRMAARANLGRYLNRALSPEQSYVLGDTGIAPYLSHASVIDALCLNSADLTRPPISFDRGRFLDSVFAHSPDLVVIHAWSPQRLAPVHDERGFYEALAADPRFLARYQLQKRAPVFHSRYPGEGFFYTIYERRPCGDPGQACCANTKCAGGCCVAGTCVASGSSCGSSIGSCNGGVCEAGSAPHD